MFDNVDMPMIISRNKVVFFFFLFKLPKVILYLDNVFIMFDLFT